jgi:hypothetical protein
MKIRIAFILVMFTFSIPLSFVSAATQQRDTPIRLPSPFTSKKMTMAPNMVSALKNASPLRIYDALFQYSFTKSLDGKTAKVRAARAMPPEDGVNVKDAVIARYWFGEWDKRELPPGFYLFHTKSDGSIANPVLYGERIEGKKLGLAEGKWTFASAWDGSLKRLQ